ncbi:MAG: hypothetical protein ACNS62_20450 [Candidatus Cyclobacteriaceae bacterium M3_2C_046]
MIDAFRNLNRSEEELMYKVPVLVTILIAGADNTIDQAELQEAIEVANLKQTNDEFILKSYYKELTNSFEQDLKTYIQKYPENTPERNQLIISELMKVNDILPKLEKQFAISFYTSMKDLAKKIAEASGGVLGYMAVGQEESAFIDLKMINDPSQII